MFVSFKSATITNGQVQLDLADSSHPNDVESTFGFHTCKTFPERNRTVTYIINAQHFSEGERNNKIEESKIKCIQAYESSNDAIFLNGLNILGYVPVLGLIPCATLLIHPLVNKKSSMHAEPKDVKIANYVRGIFAGMGIGILYLIPDLIMTVKRFCSKERHLASAPSFDGLISNNR